MADSGGMSGAAPSGCAGDQPPLPHFEVQITAPRLDAWAAGNTGVPGFWSFAAMRKGPHVCVTALTHGNEIAGAIVLDRLLRDGIRPRVGRLTLGLVNLAAFARFDPRHPTASRFVDEDFNRIWEPAVLDGPRRSSELDRAREIRPIIDSVDLLLDMHSMLWPSDPLILSGATPRGRDLALRIGYPGLIIADRGHLSGPRLIDYGHFIESEGQRTGVLVEAGQHWERGTLDIAWGAIARFLDVTDVLESPIQVPPPDPSPRFAEVTQVITATTSNFIFTQPYRGGEIIAEKGTLIACDSGTEVRTPYDNCMLVMPSLRPSRGHTAVRLARLL
jgi:predicted deacylase